MSRVSLASFCFEIPLLSPDNIGKIALVTGGGSGIGEMIATALVQNGAKVYIASRKEKQLKEVRGKPLDFKSPKASLITTQVSEALNKKGPGSCHYLIADLAVRAISQQLIEPPNLLRCAFSLL